LEIDAWGESPTKKNEERERYKRHCNGVKEAGSKASCWATEKKKSTEKGGKNWKSGISKHRVGKTSGDTSPSHLLDRTKGFRMEGVWKGTLGKERERKS